MAQNKPEDKSSSHKSVPVAKDSLGKEKRPASSEAEKLKASEWVGQKKAVWRAFPGPADKEILLRVAMERGAYAEVIAHAKELLDAEICGALAGEVCEDDAGFYVHVQGCVRGSAARQGSTHV